MAILLFIAIQESNGRQRYRQSDLPVNCSKLPGLLKPLRLLKLL